MVLGFFSAAVSKESYASSSTSSSFYIGTGINSGPLRKAALVEKARKASTLTADTTTNRRAGAQWNQQSNKKIVPITRTATAAASSRDKAYTSPAKRSSTVFDTKKRDDDSMIGRREEEEEESASLVSNTKNAERVVNLPDSPPLPPPPPSHHTSPPPPPLLVIGIPSVRRNGDADYVIRTVRYLRDQLRSPHSTKTHETGSDLLSSPYPLRVRILVLNNQRSSTSSSSSTPSEHVAFEQLLSSECNNGNAGGSSSCETVQAGPHTVYAKKNGLIALARNGAPISEKLDELSANINVPSGRVRQQARDVMSLLDLAGELFGYEILDEGVGVGEGSSGGSRDGLLSTFDDVDVDDGRGEGKNNKKPLRMFAYMFMEDDFRLCPQGFESIALALHRAKFSNMNWNAIRISYGLNGAIIRGVDVPKLSSYYMKRYTHRPPDHLLVEWFAGETVESAVIKAQRPHLSFKYNLLEHFGHTSSLRVATSSYFPYCYQLMDGKVVFEVEAFKEAECSHDIIWPCLQPSDSRFIAVSNHSRMDFEKLVKEGTELTVQKWTL